jgi:hypothetical protein
LPPGDPENIPSQDGRKGLATVVTRLNLAPAFSRNGRGGTERLKVIHTLSVAGQQVSVHCRRLSLGLGRVIRLQGWPPDGFLHHLQVAFLIRTCVGSTGLNMVSPAVDPLRPRPPPAANYGIHA